MIATGSLESLYIGGNQIGPLGSREFSSGLSKNKTLKVLSFSDNFIADSGTSSIASALTMNRNIQELSLSFNSITSLGMEGLVKSLRGYTSLHSLHIDNNKIGDSGASALASILPKLNLIVLNVGFNEITAAGLTAIMQALIEYSRLTSLTISGNYITLDVAKEVAKYLSRDSCLKEFFLDRMGLSHLGEQLIAAGIATNRYSALQKLRGFALGSVLTKTESAAGLVNCNNDQALNYLATMHKNTGNMISVSIDCPSNGYKTSSKSSDLSAYIANSNGCSTCDNGLLANKSIGSQFTEGTSFAISRSIEGCKSVEGCVGAMELNLESIVQKSLDDKPFAFFKQRQLDSLLEGSRYKGDRFVGADVNLSTYRKQLSSTLFDWKLGMEENSLLDSLTSKNCIAGREDRESRTEVLTGPLSHCEIPASTAGGVTAYQQQLQRCGSGAGSREPLQAVSFDSNNSCTGNHSKPPFSHSIPPVSNDIADGNSSYPNRFSVSDSLQRAIRNIMHLPYIQAELYSLELEYYSPMVDLSNHDSFGSTALSTPICSTPSATNLTVAYDSTGQIPSKPDLSMSQCYVSRIAGDSSSTERYQASISNYPDCPDLQPAGLEGFLDDLFCGDEEIVLDEPPFVPSDSSGPNQLLGVSQINMTHIGQDESQLTAKRKSREFATELSRYRQGVWNELDGSKSILDDVFGDLDAASLCMGLDMAREREANILVPDVFESNIENVHLQKQATVSELIDLLNGQGSILTEKRDKKRQKIATRISVYPRISNRLDSLKSSGDFAKILTILRLLKFAESCLYSLIITNQIGSESEAGPGSGFSMSLNGTQLGDFQCRGLDNGSTVQPSEIEDLIFAFV